MYARNWKPSNVTRLDDCFRSSNINTIRYDLKSYINPLIIEYSLLSVAIAVRMLVNIFRNNSVQASLPIDPHETENQTTPNELSNSSEHLTRRISKFIAISSGTVLSLPYLMTLTFAFF